MTRETKIGLLVGLAFIVVFAMLLSHSGPGTSPGDLRQIAKAKQPPTAPVVNESAVESNSPLASNPQPETTSMTEGSASPPKVDPPSPTVSEPDSLPNPDILNNTNPAGAEQPMMGVTDASENASRLESQHPKAPPASEVINPMPEARHMLPTPSPAPVAEAPPEEEHKTEVVSAEPVTHSIESKLSEIPTPTAKPGTESSKDAKEHVVLKGENLNKILNAEYPDAYKTSYKKLSAFFIAANKNHIKDEHTIIEGQKLVVPALPSNLSEPVSDGKVALNVSHKDAKLADATPKAVDRKAPSKETKVTGTVKETDKDKIADGEKAIEKEKDKDKSKDKDKLASGDKKKDRSKDKDKDVEKVTSTTKRSKDTRTYEVQAKDNFTTIAQKELGSATFWREIKRLNPDVDPAKMKLGTKLILPSKRPLADTVASGRTK